ncbi:MAG: RsmE family RNA methyltransferase [Vicinamibacterales bacterium]
MLPRFYAPDLDAELASVLLPPEEARHLTRVLRLGAGADVAIFDGRGAEFRAVVEAAVRETATVRILERLPSPPAPAVRIVLVQAVLKGDAMDGAVRDATMMGAHTIQPVLTDHTDVKPSFARRPETLDRWRRVALASVKQCRRATLPVIPDVKDVDAWMAASSDGMRLIFVEPSAGVAVRSVQSLLSEPAPATVAVLLGPEGGWSVPEADAARAAGCIPLSLGPLTLRADSMPVAALSALQVVWPR